MNLVSWMRLGLGTLCFGIAATMAIQAAGFSPLARHMPLYLGSAAALASLLVVSQDARAMVRLGSCVPKSVAEATSTVGSVDQEERRQLLRPVAVYWSWIGGYIVACLIVGYLYSTAVFLITFLRFQAKMTVFGSLVAGGTVTVALYGVASVLMLRLPEGILTW